jgi:TCP-1/cpn60 chaperonin family
MLKMLLDPMGGIVLTNDGNAILRECEVPHPAAKSMIELSRTQDEEVGDGTTSVIILGMSMALLHATNHWHYNASGWLHKSLRDLTNLLYPIIARGDDSYPHNYTTIPTSTTLKQYSKTSIPYQNYTIPYTLLNI